MEDKTQDSTDSLVELVVASVAVLCLVRDLQQSVSVASVNGLDKRV